MGLLVIIVLLLGCYTYILWYKVKMLEGQVNKPQLYPSELFKLCDFTKPDETSREFAREPKDGNDKTK